MYPITRKTINQTIQYYLEKGLKETMNQYQAKGAYGVVMNCNTGAVVAMSSMPDFDCNEPYKLTYNKNIKAIKKLSNKKYLFHYLLDPTPEKMAFIENLASENDYDIVNIMPGSFHLLGPKHIEELVYPSVYDMLSGFYHADYVVTDSFHGSAFSIILNKNFTVFANKKRGNSRLTSILSTFGLEDRIYNSGYNYMESIDYEKVNAVISEQRKRSEFIINSFLED